MQKIFSFIILALLLSCNNTTDEKRNGNLRVTDVQGNVVVLNKPAEKIVCLFDPMVDAIYMLQQQHKLIGVPAEMYADAELYTPYSLIDDRIKQKSIAIPGSNETANIESIIGLKPNLVVAQHMSAGNIQTLQQMGIAVYLASSEKYEQVMKEIEDIGILTGAADRSKVLLEYARSQFSQMQRAATTAAAKKKVYFTWANGKIFSTTGRSSMMNNVLEFAGVENVCTAPLDQPNINAETLIHWNPDMIVMWNDPADIFYNKPELAGIKAIQQKAIYNLMPMFFYNPHTLKSLCASMQINGWAQQKDSAVVKANIRNVIMELYGPALGNKLNAIL